MGARTTSEVTRENPRGNYQDWLKDERQIVRRHADRGAKAVLELVNVHRAGLGQPPRTLKSLECFAARQLISLRARGSRRGLILGQPAGESWKSGEGAEIRRAALSGECSIGTTIARIRDDVAAGITRLCPACGKRPVRVVSTGLCRPCHLRHLTQATRERAAEAAANREYQSAKQQAHREKLCSVDGCDHSANGTGGMCYAHSRAVKQAGRS